MISVEVCISEHYKERFRERVARTKRIQKFADEAYRRGKPLNNIPDARIRRDLKYRLESRPGNYSLRLYNGFLHVFSAQHPTAITVYPLKNASLKTKIC